MKRQWIVFVLLKGAVRALRSGHHSFLMAWQIAPDKSIYSKYVFGYYYRRLFVFPSSPELGCMSALSSEAGSWFFLSAGHLCMQQQNRLIVFILDPRPAVSFDDVYIGTWPEREKNSWTVFALRVLLTFLSVPTKLTFPQFQIYWRSVDLLVDATLSKRIFFPRSLGCESMVCTWEAANIEWLGCCIFFNPQTVLSHGCDLKRLN